MKDKSAKKKPGEKLNNASPEYDSVKEQTVLLEHMNQSIKTIAEQHSSIIEKLDQHSEKLDQHSKDLSVIKSELGSVKLAVKDVDQRTIKLEAGQQRIEQKLDVVTTGHEQRITKLEELAIKSNIIIVDKIIYYDILIHDNTT